MNKYYHRQNIPERLNTAEGAISIVKADPELAEALKGIGYQEEQFAEGERRVDAAARLETEQEVHRGIQMAATARLNEIYESVRRYFGDDRRLVRTAVRANRELYVQLRLHLRMKGKRDALIRQMVHFYNEVVQHSEVVQALEGQHISAERFIERIEDVNALLEALQVQQHLKGRAIVATQKRREAMEELDEWMVQFIQRARLAFKGNEEQLKKLGIGVRVPSQPEEE